MPHFAERGVVTTEDGQPTTGHPVRFERHPAARSRRRRRSTSTDGAVPLRSSSSAGCGTPMPTSFTVFFWEAESGALVATEAYRDEVTEIDGIFLPAVRRVVRGDSTGLSVRDLELSNHVLLGVAVAS